LADTSQEFSILGGSMTYAEKLKDPRWQKKRLKVFERDHWECTNCCNKHRPLHVHHLKYNGNPWKTKMKYLTTLCDYCHEFQHEIDKKSIKVKVSRHGFEGWVPTDYKDCPRFVEDGYITSCASSSGSSFCCGFYGEDKEAQTVNCWWKQ
jgi:hypothetical protein